MAFGEQLLRVIDLAHGRVVPVAAVWGLGWRRSDRPRDRPARHDHGPGRLRVRRTKKVIGACLDEQVGFSLTLSRNRRVTKAIKAIDDDAFTPVHYPGAVEDPDTGALISDAEVAETPYTLTVRGHGRVTARLMVRRVRDARYPDGPFPV